MYLNKLRMLCATIYYLPSLALLFVYAMYCDYKFSKEKEINLLKIKKRTSTNVTIYKSLENILEKIIGKERYYMLKLNLGKSKEERYIVEASKVADMDDSRQFTVVMAGLSKLQKQVAKDKTIRLGEDGGVAGLNAYSVGYETVLIRLIGWENLCDENGTPIPFDEDVKQEVLEAMPDAVVDELIERFGMGSSTKKSADK